MTLFAFPGLTGFFAVSSSGIPGINSSVPNHISVSNTAIFLDSLASGTSNWSCDFCSKSKHIYKPDSPGHVIECDEFKEMRNNVDMSNEINVVDYFAKIVKKRNELTVP